MERWDRGHRTATQIRDKNKTQTKTITYHQYCVAVTKGRSGQSIGAAGGEGGIRIAITRRANDIDMTWLEERRRRSLRRHSKGSRLDTLANSLARPASKALERTQRRRQNHDERVNEDCSTL